MEERTCKECGDTLKGRADQKFCSDQCRTSWNNKQNSSSNAYITKVNTILRKNRKVLAAFAANNKQKVHGDMLREKGFNFDYHTNTSTSKDGKVFYYCYEQGYLPTGNDFYTLFTSKEYRKP